LPSFISHCTSPCMFCWVCIKYFHLTEQLQMELYFHFQCSICHKILKILLGWRNTSDLCTL
jgi:hypothetical protein